MVRSSWAEASVQLQQLRATLGEAVAGAPSPLAAADELCAACVELLPVDGAAISVVDGATQATFGSSGQLSRTLGELQFTHGQGPGIDAVAHRTPVVVDDLEGPGRDRWPALTEAVLKQGVRAVFALPITIASMTVGALDLYRCDSGPLEEPAMSGALWAARLAALPLQDLMSAASDRDAAADAEAGWDQIAGLERLEVYRATGFLIGALGVTAADGTVRLRAHAITHGLTASEVAYQILDGSLVVDDGDWHPADIDERGAR